jgi:dTDP-4-dehydrorhamnose reductase
MKILILGKGYIGSNLVKQNSIHEIVHISKKDINYTDPAEFSKFLSLDTFDWIINCTGFTGTPNVDGCEDYKEDCYHYNVTVPLYLTKVANTFNIPILHIGSGCVYTGYNKPYTESDPTNFGADSYDSSFYSKTKDAFEKLSAHLQRYILRIRIPFNGIPEPKNYLWKLLHYDNLISMQNSITNVDDLITFIYKFIELKPETGVYNVVNNGSIDARAVVAKLREKGLENERWHFIETQAANFRVARSNCVLSTEKIQKIGLQLPDINESLERAIQEYSNKTYKK